MRLPPIAPAGLTPEQRSLYDDMRDGIAESFKGFVAIRDDGALLGPFNPWLHEPSFGKASLDLVRRSQQRSSARSAHASPPLGGSSGRGKPGLLAMPRLAERARLVVSCPRGVGQK